MVWSAAAMAAASTLGRLSGPLIDGTRIGMHTRPHLRRDTRDVSRCPGVVVAVGFVFRDDQDLLTGANVRAVDEQILRSLVEPCLQCQMLFHTVRHCFRRVGGYPH